MVDDKHWGEAAESEAQTPKGEPGRPESEEFFSEIRRRQTFRETPDSDIVTSSQEVERTGTVDPRIVGDSKAFEEEMDDL